MSGHEVEHPETSIPPASRPPHPQQRREPLPWQHRKPDIDDPRAAARVQAILESPNYRPAEFDTDFLRADANRGLRLQLDYAKAEQALSAAAINHTVVVFGSTRMHEPACALRSVAALRMAVATHPTDAGLRRRLAVAERLAAKSRYYDVARELGRLIGRDADRGVTLMTGGGPGIMEAANRGCDDVGATSVGLNITLPHEQFPNPYVTPELCFSFRYFALRKLHFLKRACALVAFPGGYGTFDELFETLTLVQTRKIRPVPIVLVGRAWWERAVDLEFLVDEGVIDAEDRELFGYAETADDIWNGILAWHRANGTPLGGDAPDGVQR